MFLTVIVLPLIELFISIGKLWILFLSVVATLVIVLVDYQVKYFQYTFDCYNLLQNQFIVWGFQSLGIKHCATYFATQVLQVQVEYMEL